MAVATAITCDLCGLAAPAPLTAHVGGQDHHFCCTGCRQVYQILAESHQLEEGIDPTQTTLYQQCLTMGLIAHPGPNQSSHPTNDRKETSAPSEISTFSEIEVTSERPRDTLDTVREAAFQVSGMWCASCAWLIEHAVGQVRGVTGCRVYFASDVVKVHYLPARTAPEEIARTIQKLGYAAERYDAQEASARKGRGQATLSRAVIALVFAMNAMMLQLPFYTDFFSKQGLSYEAMRLLPLFQLAVSVPVLVAGWPIFVKAFQAARHHVATMETLITLGSLAAFGDSLWLLSHGSSHVYFDTADMLIALILVGKHLESGAKVQAADAVTLLHGLLPKKATLIAPDGREVLVALGKLTPGDRVIVRPGERIPTDGCIISGTALVDESLLTGEARHARKQSGDQVTGATITVDAPLIVEVTHVGDSGTLAQMIALVESALSSKTRAERWADQVSRVFVPVIILLALLTGVGMRFGLHMSWDATVLRMVAVLVIACPCALGLATPMAIATGLGAAARRGILIGETGILEMLPRVRHLLLDKTGTLTEGRFAVREMLTVGRGCREDLAALAALENASEHPLARALLDYASEQDLPDVGLVGDFARHEGEGLTGILHGDLWFIGNRALAIRQGADIPEFLARRAAEFEAQGQTVLFYGMKNCTLSTTSSLPPDTLRGLISLGDVPRPGASEVIARLQALGFTLEVVSGDSEETTQAIAASLGIAQVSAQMRPAEKAARVQTQQSAFQTIGGAAPVRVAMVGDGINDAPALAQADIGIAFGSGTEIARRAADVILIGDDLGRLADLFVLSQKTARVMRQNLVWACVYNAAAIPLAMCGLVSPLIAAAAMLGSSLSVLANTRRLRHQLEKSA